MLPAWHEEQEAGPVQVAHWERHPSHTAPPASNLPARHGQALPARVRKAAGSQEEQVVAARQVRQLGRHARHATPASKYPAAQGHWPSSLRRCRLGSQVRQLVDEPAQVWQVGLQRAQAAVELSKVPLPQRQASPLAVRPAGHAVQAEAEEQAAHW